MKDPISFEALYESSQKCQKGVIWKDSVAAYSLNALERTIKLADALKDGSYESREPYHFYITRPKLRLAASICFKDRVYQRSLNDNAIYPQLTRSFVYDNGACQKNKGTDFTRKRLTAFLQKAYRKHGTVFYVLQCDIHGYYPNMHHDVVEEYFRKHLDGSSAERAISVLREQYPGDIGYNPGSQMLQLAGISVLNNLDHFIKERLRIKYYVRYMDDFILLHPDRKYLEKCQAAIAAELIKIKMELHPDKTRIFPISDGLRFLGFDFKLAETGKVVKTLPSSAVKLERKHLRHLVELAKAGRIPKWKVNQCLESWEAHAKKGNTYHVRMKMREFYDGLWSENML